MQQHHKTVNFAMNRNLTAVCQVLTKTEAWTNNQENVASINHISKHIKGQGEETDLQGPQSAPVAY